MAAKKKAYDSGIAKAKANNARKSATDAASRRFQTRTGSESGNAYVYDRKTSVTRSTDTSGKKPVVKYYAGQVKAGNKANPGMKKKFGK